MKDALAAKAAMKARLRSANIAASVGITKQGQAHALKVNLPDAAHISQIPGEIEGTPVVVEVIGQVHAIAARR